MSRIIRVFVFFFAIILTACGGQESIPTLVPSATAPQATATSTATRTPVPTPTATEPIPQTTSTDTAKQASIRVVHASPDAGAVDFYVDGLGFATFIDYGQYTEQTGLVEGDYTLRVVPNGSKDFSTALYSLGISIKGGQSFIFVLSGSKDNLSILALNEDLTPLNADESRLTIINVLPSKASISAFNGTTEIASNVTYGASSATTKVAKGELALNLRSNGEIIYGQTLKLRERLNYTLVVLSPIENPNKAQPLQLLTTIQGLATLNFINVSDGISADFYANGVALATDVGYGYITEPQSIRSQEYTLNLFASGVDIVTVQPLLSTTINFVPDENVTLVLMGTASDLRLVPRRLDTTPTASNTARISFINALPNVPRTQAQSNTSFLVSVNYGRIADGGEIAAGALPLTWYQLENNQPTGDAIEYQPNFTVNAGVDYLYILRGRSDLPPLVYETTVGAEIATPSPEEIAAIPTTVAPPTFRGINAIEGLTIEVRVDDVPVAQNLASRSGGTAAIVSIGEHVFTAVRTDTNQLLTRAVATVKEGFTYTGVVLGDELAGYQIFLVEQERVEPNAFDVTMRLINISQDTSLMGLAYTISGGSTVAFPDINATPDPNNPSSADRISLPIGLNRLVSQISAPNFSDVVIVRNGVGLQDLYIIDEYLTQVANIMPSVALEAGTQYDIIAYDAVVGDRVTAFIVPFKQP